MLVWDGGGQGRHLSLGFSSWPKRAVCKTATQVVNIGSSNLPPTTISKRAVAEYGRRAVQRTRVNVDNEHINQTVLARSVLVGKGGSSSWTIPTVLH